MNTSTDLLHGLLDERGVLLLDGAMGTELFARGLTSGDSPELWNVENPDRVQAVHDAYLSAGSDIILTNTFGGSRYRLALHKLDTRAIELNRAGAEIARAAVDASGRQALVGGSMGQTGELIEPLGERTMQQMTDAFAEQASGLAAGGADIIWIETMSALNEIEAAVTGARLGAPDLPIVTTISFDTNGRSMMGVTGGQLAELGARLELDGIGANCGATVAQTEAAVAEVVGQSSGIIVVSKANAGIPVWKEGGLSYDGSPEIMAAHALRMRAAGVNLIGACCGSSAAHIALMRQALDGTIEIDDIAAPGPAPREVDPDGEAPRRRRRRG